MCAKRRKRNVPVGMVETKRGTQLFSRLTMGGGLNCRDAPVGIRNGNGERLIVEPVGVSNLSAEAIETTPTQRKRRSTPGPPFSYPYAVGCI